jgi:ATP:cob(I)alamin adenosyltransferase
MVRLNRIYTRTGDDGSTGLVDGSRVSKASHRPVVMGSVDEANAAIGLARLSASPATDAILSRIQNDLFDLGADVATPDGVEGALRIVAAQVDWLETQIDAANDTLEPLKSFILPAGTASAFIADINGLIDNLLATFPAVFEHPSFQQKKSAIDRAFNQRYDKATYFALTAQLRKELGLP